MEKEGQKERKKGGKEQVAEDWRVQRKLRRGSRKIRPRQQVVLRASPRLLPHRHLPPIQPFTEPRGPKERFPFLTEPWRGASMNTPWMEAHKQLTGSKLRPAKRLGAPWSVWLWCLWSHSWGFAEHVLFMSPAHTHRLWIQALSC